MIDTIQLETTNHCNNNCKFCPHHNIKLHNHMTMELFKKIIDECVEIKPNKIVPFLNGEPFLDPLFFDRLHYIREKLPDVFIEIHTNGHLLTKQVVESLNNHRVNFVNVSVNAVSEEVYQLVTGSKNLKSVETNTKYFCSHFKGKKRVSLVPVPENVTEVEEFKKRWEGFDCEVQINQLYNWAGNIYLSETRLEPCFRIMSHMTILCDGRVNLCCMSPDKIIGDLNTQSIKEVWEDNKWMRLMHIKGKRPMLSPCKDCNMK